MTTPERNDRFDRLAEKQRLADAKLARWFKIPALAERQGAASDDLGEIEATILQFSLNRPASLVRQLRAYGPRFYRAVGGATESHFIAATVVGGETPLLLPTGRFSADGAVAHLLGVGLGEELVRANVVRFAHGAITVDAVNYPAEEPWALFCLSSDADPTTADYLEVFALRWGRLPAGGADPYDFAEQGHIAAANMLAAESGWSGARLDGLRCVAAVRMEVLIEEAVAQLRARGSVGTDQTYLIDQLQASGKRLVAGTVQAIGSRLRNG